MQPRLISGAICCIVALCAVLAPLPVLAQKPPGEVLFTSNREGGIFEIYRMATDGSALRRVRDEPGEAGDMSWSPDGSQVLFTAVVGKGTEVHLTTLANGQTRRLTHDGTLNSSPVWSPDGERIVFRSYRDRSPRLYIMNADGSGQRRLTDSDDEEVAPAFSPDGNSVVYVAVKNPKSTQIKVVDLRTGKTRLLGSDPPVATETGPVWSPDGTRIAYTVAKDRIVNIFVMAADGSGKVALTQGRDRNNFPLWSPDGSRILFLATGGGSARQDVYTMKPDGSELLRLTNDGAEHMMARWSPDGTRIFFVKFLAGGGQIFSIDINSKMVQRLSDGNAYDTGIALCCSRPRAGLTAMR